MRLTGDYHTHSKYSRNNHGKNTIAEMVATAEQKGLSSYGISDHGPAHFLFGIRRKNIDKAKSELESLKKETKLNLFFGIEANLIKKDGGIDLSEQEIEKLDLLLVGYHRGTITNFYSKIRNLFNLKKQKQINTQAYINCLNKYHVDILTHINEYIRVDVEAVARAAKERGTLIELNNKHIRFNAQEAEGLKRSGCKFIISSDAHKKEDIARVDRAMEFVQKYSIDPEKIVNIDKIYK